MYIVTISALILSAIAGEPAPPVVGGEISAEGSWPDAASIYFGNSVDCTGTLIGPNAVLTAGHCAGGITSVRVGEVDFSTGGGELISVQTEHVYPGWFQTYDVTLLVLESESTVTPRVIAQDCIIEESLVDGAATVVAGWGANDPRGNRYDSLLREGSMEIIDHDCSETERGCMVQIQQEQGELAAAGEADACFGDSGGPLYLETPTGYYLAGITSRGFDNSRGSPCGPGTIFVRPDALIDWIEDTLGYALERPACDENTDTGNTDTDTDSGIDTSGGDTALDTAVTDTGGELEVKGGCGCATLPDGKSPWGLSLVVLGYLYRRRRL